MLCTSKSSLWLSLFILCLISLAGLAWQQMPNAGGNRVVRDTVPEKNSDLQQGTVINGDLEKAMEEVKKAQENLSRQLQGPAFDKMQKDMLKAQGELNRLDIKAKVEEALKNIDLQKLNAQVQLKNIDWEKMQQEIAKVQAELNNTIDHKKMETAIQQSMQDAQKAMGELKAIDMEKIQLELERAGEKLRLNEGHMMEELKRAQKELNKGLQNDLRNQLEKAKKEVDNAAAELDDYKNMLSQMNREGLLKETDSYTIVYKKGVLVINGVKQPDSVTDRYKHYFKKEKVTLIKTKHAEGGEII